MIGLLPGHGGNDPGAVSPAGWREADLVRDVAAAARVEALLAGGGPDLVVEDGGGTYRERERRAAKRGALRAVVQLHADAVEAEVGPDRATLFYWPGSASGRRLAHVLADALEPVLPWPVLVLEALPGRWGRAHGVLRQHAATAVLVELGFTDGALGRVRLPELVVPLGEALARGAAAWTP